jgi:hypothetical protein
MTYYIDTDKYIDNSICSLIYIDQILSVPVLCVHRPYLFFNLIYTLLTLQMPD